MGKAKLISSYLGQALGSQGKFAVRCRESPHYGGLTSASQWCRRNVHSTESIL